MPNITKFKSIASPHGSSHYIPEDLNLVFPQSNLPIDKQHFLVYIPRDTKYLKSVPVDYLDFFKVALPYLNTRTTNVHTAIVLGFLKDLTQGKPVNQRVVVLALILHDSGWSKLSDLEIADSLGVTGLKLTQQAIAPKEKHAIESVKIAKKLLNEFKFQSPLKALDLELILDAIRHHDQPEKVSHNGTIPLEVQLVADLDHLWSFTRENFWQDTVRKGILPEIYLTNLSHDLDSYFVTPTGKAKARQLLIDRKPEVDQLK